MIVIVLATDARVTRTRHYREHAHTLNQRDIEEKIEIYVTENM